MRASNAPRCVALSSALVSRIDSGGSAASARALRSATSRTSAAGTIAHGFLTLSLLSHLSESTFSFHDRKMGVNYGLNRVRFTSPVPVGSRVRARFTLAKFERIENSGVQVTWHVTIEREGAAKPALVAEWIGRHYY